MTVCTADFETGTNGNNVLTSDTGSLTAWNLVFVNNSGTVTYSNAQVAHGSLAAFLNANGNNSDRELNWSTAIGTPTEGYGRAYVYFTSLPIAGASYFLRHRRS